MIVTCPSCTTRFVLGSSVLDPGGRQVRCGVCQHEWYQEPEEEIEEGTDEQEDNLDLDDIAGETEETDEEAIDLDMVDSPSEEPEDDIPLPKKRVVEEEETVQNDTTSKIAGFAAAACVLLILFAGLIPMKQSVTSLWPSSQVIFNMMGFAEEIPGKNLVFERLNALKKEGKIHFSGQIVNIDAEHSTVLPPLLLSLLSKEDEVLDRILVPFDQLSVAAGEVEKFEKDIADAQHAVSKIKVRFALTQEQDKVSNDSKHDEEKDHHDNAYH